MVRILDSKLIEQTLQKARESPRKRANYCFHNPDESLQRMVNAALFDTYFRPHKHENPDKLEIFSILKGKVAILTFDEAGGVVDVVRLDEEVKSVEIPPKTWHTVVVLSPEAVFHEIIDGKYDPKTHKEFSSWSPEEENVEEVKKYLDKLRAEVGI